MNVGNSSSNSTSLLLIFAAIDLLCSAMVSGVLLVVVLIGGTGDSYSASEGEGGATGGTVIEAVLPASTKFEIEGQMPVSDETQPATGIAGKILPDGSRRIVYMLPPGLTRLYLRVSGPLVANVYGGMGDALGVFISCDQAQLRLMFQVFPDIGLPSCAGAVSGRQPKAFVGWTPFTSRASGDSPDPLLATGAIVRKAAKNSSFNRAYDIKADTNIPTEIGVWAVGL
jgi:hypothetical protein